MEDKDHDLLVTISTDLTWLKSTLLEHIKEASANHVILETKVNAAHRRIDTIQLSGILSIIVLALTIWLKK